MTVYIVRKQIILTLFKLRICTLNIVIMDSYSFSIQVIEGAELCAGQETKGLTLSIMGKNHQD